MISSDARQWASPADHLAFLLVFGSIDHIGVEAFSPTLVVTEIHAHEILSLNLLRRSRKSTHHPVHLRNFWYGSLSN